MTTSKRLWVRRSSAVFLAFCFLLCLVVMLDPFKNMCNFQGMVLEQATDDIIQGRPQDWNTTALIQRLMAARRQSNNNNSSMKETATVQYVLGFSTGHSGSTTVDAVLRSTPGCGWQPSGKFEVALPKEMDNTPLPASCHFAAASVLPYLDETKHNDETEKHWNASTWIDLGHFHNRNGILECLADLLESEVALIRIRRNRHAIANSFAKAFTSPCPFFWDVKNHPRLAYCPNETHGPTALPVADAAIWNAWTPFQKFLWLADDMELRWYRLVHKYAKLLEWGHLQQQPNGGKSAPWFHEITWSTSDELQQQIHQLVHDELQCQTDDNAKNKPVPNRKKHVKHKSGALNCTRMIYEDLVYRQQLQPTLEHDVVLFHNHPQALSAECAETPEQLQTAILQMASDLRVPTSLEHWTLPPAKE